MGKVLKRERLRVSTKTGSFPFALTHSPLFCLTLTDIYYPLSSSDPIENTRTAGSSALSIGREGGRGNSKAKFAAKIAYHNAETAPAVVSSVSPQLPAGRRPSRDRVGKAGKDGKGVVKTPAAAVAKQTTVADRCGCARVCVVCTCLSQ